MTKNLRKYLLMFIMYVVKYAVDEEIFITKVVSLLKLSEAMHFVLLCWYPRVSRRIWEVMGRWGAADGS